MPDSHGGTGASFTPARCATAALSAHPAACACVLPCYMRLRCTCMPSCMCAGALLRHNSSVGVHAAWRCHGDDAQAHLCSLLSGQWPRGTCAACCMHVSAYSSCTGCNGWRCVQLLVHKHCVKFSVRAYVAPNVCLGGVAASQLEACAAGRSVHVMPAARAAAVAAVVATRSDRPHTRMRHGLRGQHSQMSVAETDGLVQVEHAAERIGLVMVRGRHMQLLNPASVPCFPTPGPADHVPSFSALLRSICTKRTPNLTPAGQNPAAALG